MADLAASVLARLRNQADASGRTFQLSLQLFCQEEFLRRLAASDYQNKLVLKGGHLIYCLTEFSSRPTVDIDFLAQDTANTIEGLENILKRVINTPTGNDFVSYEIKRIEEISIDKKYPGLSAILEARIKNTRTPLKIDFGFGDIVYPREQLIEVPTQLDGFSPPLVNTYSLETVIAEKLDAILNLMEFSSRMKDYYDLYLLSATFDFDGDRLRSGLIITFDYRDRAYKQGDLTKLLAFDQNKAMINKWMTFMKRLKLSPMQFDQAIETIGTFLTPVWDSIFMCKSLDSKWHAHTGRWKAASENALL